MLHAGFGQYFEYWKYFALILKLIYIYIYEFHDINEHNLNPDWCRGVIGSSGLRPLWNRLKSTAPCTLFLFKYSCVTTMLLPILIQSFHNKYNNQISSKNNIHCFHWILSQMEAVCLRLCSSLECFTNLDFNLPHYAVFFIYSIYTSKQP